MRQRNTPTTPPSQPQPPVGRMPRRIRCNPQHHTVCRRRNSGAARRSSMSISRAAQQSLDRSRRRESNCPRPIPQEHLAQVPQPSWMIPEQNPRRRCPLKCTLHGGHKMASRWHHAQRFRPPHGLPPRPQRAKRSPCPSIIGKSHNRRLVGCFSAFGGSQEYSHT